MSNDILITQEMLDNDPTLAQAGHKVGDRLPDPAGHVMAEQPVQPLQPVVQAAPAPAVDNTNLAAPQPQVQAAGLRNNQPTSFDVIDGAGAYVRSYTLEIHKEEAEQKALQFANKIGGTVVRK